MKHLIRAVFRRLIGTQNVRRITQLKAKHDMPGFALLEQNKKFHNLHSGKRCFILGNGPSLKNVDFSSLKDEITFSVNQLPRNPNFPLLHTNYHFWADARFFDLRADRPEDIELLQVMKNVATQDNTPIVFYKLAAYPMVKKYELDKKLNIFYYGEYRTSRKNALKHQVDFTQFVPGFSTVVHYIICMAVYMGFKEIYLLGCDCSGFITTAQAKLQNASAAEYSYRISENEKKRMERVAKQTSIISELTWYVNMFKDYEYLDQYCKHYDVKLFNATEGGLLESIPRVHLKDVLVKK